VSVTQKNRQEKALEQLGGVPEALRVSVVRYLNTAPLIWGLEQGPLRERYRLNLTLPSSCADDLAAGRAEVGILPSFAYQAIPGMAVIPGISIASERKVESVLLVSRKPARRAKRVALDTSSRTSVALVRVLFARHWGADPEYTEAEPDLGQMLKENDAALVIGDPALRFMLKAPGTQLGDVSNLHVYDLAEEWWRLTHLPFVFAFWAVRKEAVADAGARQRLVRDFQSSRDQGLQHIEEIAHKAAEALSVSGGQLERYLKSSIDYRLDAPHQAGLECFFRFARELGLLDDVRPLEFL
jgi:chorismate dehydratase